MGAILEALKSILKTLTLNADNIPFVALTLGLCLIAAWITFRKMASALKFPMDTGWRPIVSFLSFVIATLAAAVLIQAFASPHISSPAVAKYIPLMATAVILLAGILPLSCFLMKSKYLQTLSAFLAPVIAAAIVAFLLKGISGAIKQGEKGFSETKKRTDTFNEEISR